MGIYRTVKGSPPLLDVIFENTEFLTTVIKRAYRDLTSVRLAIELDSGQR